METRICSLCQTEKPITEFLERADRPSKKYSRCKDCHREVKKNLAKGIYPYPDKSCKFCANLFRPKSPNQLFCCPECKTKYSQAHGSMEVTKQYERINNNWPKYFHRLIVQKQREYLTVPMLLELYDKQKGLCALTGVPLECVLEVGKINPKNASIDRITHGCVGGEYKQDNIRLVCSIVNKMRQALTDEELRHWCKLIVEGGPESCLL
jgi:hypothetical protein